MREATTAAPTTETTRSSAIYRSADQLCALIEAEIAHAIQPYKDDLEYLSQQLHAAQDKNTRLVQDTSILVTQATADAARKLSALKNTLDKHGFGVAAEGGRLSLCFVGEPAARIADIDEQVKRLAPNPAAYKPISPGSVVDVLVHTLKECTKRVDEAQNGRSSAVEERDELDRALAQRKAEWDAERTQLESTFQEERDKAVHELNSFRSEAQTLNVRLLSARTESNMWKAKSENMETERDSLKTAIETNDGVQAELDVWKAKFLAVEGDIKAATDESNGKLRSLQAQADGWKVKFLAAMAVVKAATDDKSAADAEVEAWKGRALDAGNALEAEKTRMTGYLDASRAELAQWESKAASWQTERTRHKTQAARNAALITQLQATSTNLEGQLRDAETERSQLKATLQAGETQYVALQNELEEAKKLHAALQTDNVQAHARCTALQTKFEETKNAYAECTELRNELEETKKLQTSLQADNAAAHAKHTALENQLEQTKKLQAALQADNAQAQTKYTALQNEFEEAKKKPAAPSSQSKLPPSMFIPRAQARPALDKSPSQAPSPRLPASAHTSPMASRSFCSPNPTPTPSASTPAAPSDQSQSPDMARRGAPTTGQHSSSQRKAQPRAPPALSSSSSSTREVLRDAPSITRAVRSEPDTPARRPASASTSSGAAPSIEAPRGRDARIPAPSTPRPARASPAHWRHPAPRTAGVLRVRVHARLQTPRPRPAIQRSVSTPTPTPKPAPAPDASLKRSAPSPLLGARAKVPRTDSLTLAPTSRTTRFTKPPTPIVAPVRTPRAASTIADTSTSTSRSAPPSAASESTVTSSTSTGAPRTLRSRSTAARQAAKSKAPG
ncbi:hypothetical protein B0H17DRAFT_636797 [Mycena rosella]|uniref:Uncharacterized protein n=1 Tax=Mycena rosella TaxID=1033263 RepID=A0AAD7DG19_MYCRO|nr:hypothetical protein B0H17DRAFT_636797 [Mycena rosella]